MSKYVIINPAHGGNETGKVNNGVKESDYNLKIATEISRLLNSAGIPNKLIRNSDQSISEEARINQIVSSSPNTSDTIVLTISMDSETPEIEIVYALRNTDKLAVMLANNLNDSGFTVSKYYERRLPSDTGKDYHSIIRDTGKRESLIIEYGNLSDSSFIVNNWKELAAATAKALGTYLGSVGNYYTVKSGDSLYSIATKYGISVDDIKKANGLGTNLLSVGQKLLIPEVEQGEEPTPEPSGNVYVVKNGDTLYSIAGAYHITVDSLKTANNLSGSALKIGQKLIIPTIGDTTSVTKYTVKSGDNLYNIASKYGVSVDAIKSANGLTNNVLQIGQTLKIPSSSGNSPSGITYTVKSGDNLYSIASKYGVSVDAIKSANNLTSNALQIGQTLKIPSSSGNPPSGITYTVKSGDNLYNIAQKYNVSVASIMGANNLKTTLLSVGQKLVIPV